MRQPRLESVWFRGASIGGLGAHLGIPGIIGEAHPGASGGGLAAPLGVSGLVQGVSWPSRTVYFRAVPRSRNPHFGGIRNICSVCAVAPTSRQFLHPTSCQISRPTSPQTSPQTSQLQHSRRNKYEVCCSGRHTTRTLLKGANTTPTLTPRLLF